MTYSFELLDKACKKFDLSITDQQKIQFIKYHEVLTEWNKVVNLTRITDFHEVIVKHFVDSLAIIRVLDMNTVKTMIDVGTGAGFPGVPIKIMFPHIAVTLLDSSGKRIEFLDFIIDKLELSNTVAVHGRAEEFGVKKEYREKYDLAVSRAVSNLSVLSELCLPFVKVDGSFVSYKSGKSADEVDGAKPAIGLLGGDVKEFTVFNLLELDLQRSLVRIDKISDTPLKYPRRPGMPAKKPL
ncbi:MAG: 16S rRNA (guanine(527)-N(7))-methyltransferase RsmG [Lachnospiraceae bacterium]